MRTTAEQLTLETDVLFTLVMQPETWQELPEGFSAHSFQTGDYKVLLDEFLAEHAATRLTTDWIRFFKDHPEREPVYRDISKHGRVLNVNGEFKAYVKALLDPEATTEGIRASLVRSQLRPITSEEIRNTLSLTIKQDEVNKLIVFMAQLSAFTENSQINVSFNAPSSTGKSYIPLEIAELFPKEDVIKVAYCSPTAFFHSHGEFNKERNGYTVDLERKVLIFLDQPHTKLVEHLRPLLSHDSKEIKLMITDKTQKSGTKTKNIFIKGYPAVVFCSASVRVDEQEASRFILLSPETSQEKIRLGVEHKIKRETDAEAFSQWLEADPGRRMLKDRIKAIKEEGITEIKISDPDTIRETFLANSRVLRPRDQRDIGRIIGLVKVFALLNLWFRERDGSTIASNEEDIQEAFNLWGKIAESQELNLPPYIFQLYSEVILPAYKEKNAGQTASGVKFGLSRKDIVLMHFDVYGRPLADWMLRQQILPMLEASGLIVQESDPDDKRKILVYPTTQLTISQNQNNPTTTQYLNGE